MQLILKAFFDLIMMRKGPEDLPRSSLLLLFAIAMAVAVNMLFYLLVEPDYETDYGLDLAIELVKILSYTTVLLTFGMMNRGLQTFTAIIACNAILGFLMTVVLVICQPLTDKSIEGALVWLITIWLILVEGRIIARSVQLQWVTGIAIAVVIFILQLGFYFYFGEIPEGAVG